VETTTIAVTDQVTALVTVTTEAMVPTPEPILTTDHLDTTLHMLVDTEADTLVATVEFTIQGTADCMQADTLDLTTDVTAELTLIMTKTPARCFRIL